MPVLGGAVVVVVPPDPPVGPVRPVEQDPLAPVVPEPVELPVVVFSDGGLRGLLGLTDRQRPPQAVMFPLTWPGALSPTKRYRGIPS